MLTAQVTAPRSRLLHIVGSVELSNDAVGDFVKCLLHSGHSYTRDNV